MSSAPAPRNLVPAIIKGVALVLLAGGALLTWRLAVDGSDEAELWRTFRMKGILLALAATAAAASGIYILFGRGPRRSRVFRVLLAFMSSGFVLGALELPAVAFGHDYQQNFGVHPADTWLQIALGINRSDPELIHIHNPHDKFVGEVSGNLESFGLPALPRYNVDVRYDRHGFRNDRDFDHAEVIVIGDSFIEAAIVPFPETVGEVIATRLGTPVANLGQEGYGLRQELAALRRFGMPLQPKLVLWFVFGGNDLRDARAYEDALKHSAEGGRKKRLKERLFTTSALLALSKITTPARSEPSTFALQRSGIFTREDGVRERMYFDDGTESYDDHSWKVATEVLGEAHRLCREGTAQFVLIYIARKFRVYRNHVEFAPGCMASKWKPSGLPDRLSAWAQSQGIPFLDLSPAMEQEVKNGRHPYNIDDVHWNARGHATAATAVLRTIEPLGWKTRGASGK